MPERTDSDNRRVFNAYTTPFLEYDLEGPVQPEMSWLPVSYDRETGHGTDEVRQAGVYDVTFNTTE